ncbi:MAG: type VI secretion system protein TssA [bacterium]
MKRVVHLDALLAPVPGDTPSGKNLRYSPTYDAIKEARRAEDPLAQGEWKHEVKTSDWDKVITLAVNALMRETKDLQIAAWLTEALIVTEGFDGLSTGLKILTGFITDYWESVYPLIEEEDLEFRAAPLEFMNEKLPSCIMQIPLTDRSVTPGYSLLTWKESREVGSEADTRNQYGDVDEDKRRKRDELIADGKTSAEEFDRAASLSKTAFYKSLAESITACHEDFRKFDEIVDQYFGSDAPRLAELRGAIEECSRLIMKIYKERKEQEPAPDEPDAAAEENAAAGTGKDREQAASVADGGETAPKSMIPPAGVSSTLLRGAALQQGTDTLEKDLWEEALRLLKTSGLRQALDSLLAASFCAPSVRDRCRCRLLVAKLCLKADRPDLARPIIEELHGLIEELHLERWESPLWIAEVLDTLYLCLTGGEPSDDDLDRARVLFRRLCAMDVTKVISYRK